MEIKKGTLFIGKHRDCMLTYDTTLRLIELKNKRRVWQTEGLAQIENTIGVMCQSDPQFYHRFTKRKAIVANKQAQSPACQETNIALRQTLYKTYKMRVQFEAEIVIK